MRVYKRVVWIRVCTRARQQYAAWWDCQRQNQDTEIIAATVANRPSVVDGGAQLKFTVP